MKLKVFLSHGMNGVSEEEVIEIRRKAIAFLESRYGNIEVIDNYHHDDAPEDAGRLWHLGRSVQQMGEADIICFCPGWNRHQGCCVEHDIALRYHLEIVYMKGELICHRN